MIVNAICGWFVVGPILAPLLLAARFDAPARALYSVFHALCHQWAFRSFFLLGPEVTYSRDALEAFGANPYSFVGSAETGWKMAFCERNVAIFVGVLAFGLVYAAARRRLAAATAAQFVVLIAPMAFDGLTQFAGWRESTWELRVVTGTVFGVACAWYLYPRLGIVRPSASSTPTAALLSI